MPLIHHKEGVDEPAKPSPLLKEASQTNPLQWSKIHFL